MEVDKSCRRFMAGKIRQFPDIRGSDLGAWETSENLNLIRSTKVNGCTITSAVCSRRRFVRWKFGFGAFACPTLYCRYPYRIWWSRNPSGNCRVEPATYICHQINTRTSVKFGAEHPTFYLNKCYCQCAQKWFNWSLIWLIESQCRFPPSFVLNPTANRFSTKKFLSPLWKFFSTWFRIGDLLIRWLPSFASSAFVNNCFA